MSNIRRQSIISSVVIYIGFAVGLLNTYFFTTYFTPAQYGLTSIFIAIAMTMLAFATLAMPSYIFKFYHYYNDHLPRRKNDMLTWALLVGTIGFILVMTAGWLFKSLVIRKFGYNSPELIQYYYWIFPMGFGLTIFTILEAYTWNVGKSVLTNFMREVLWRLLTTLLIVFFIFRIVNDFELFIKLYAFCYPVIAAILFAYLLFTGKVHFTFKASKVSRRYFKKIVLFNLFFYSANIVSILSQVIDSIVIASVLPNGLTNLGIFTLAQNMKSIIEAPQRGVVSAAIPHLSRAWKDKNRERLQTIYQRSSINLLIFSVCIFLLIALNYSEAIITFGLREDYLLGFNTFILLGLVKVVDMGTGLNAQIIGTSNYWRFELISGIILVIVMVPLTVVFTKNYGIIGPGIANLISIFIYNLMRIIFLWYKFRLFPFTMPSLYTVLLGTSAFIISYYLFRDMHGMAGLCLRSLVFLLLFAGGAIGFRLTPDIQPVLKAVRRRLGWGK